MDVGALEQRTKQTIASLDAYVEDKATLLFYLGLLKEYTAPFEHRDYVHSMRVGLYAYELSLDEPFELRVPLTMAGFSHDFGKLLLPQKLLHSKPMDAAERKLLQPHPTLGYCLLREWNAVCAATAGNHHWRDGQGYGMPLDEMALSCEERAKVEHISPLVTLADCFEAYHSRNDGRFGKEHTPSRFVQVLKELNVLLVPRTLDLLYARQIPSA